MIRQMTLLLLTLVLVLTSQSMVAARGASAATGQMVICTGTGSVVVYTDAQGQPTSAPVMCPDAALQVPVDGAARALGAPQMVVPFVPPQALLVPAPLTSERLVPPSRAPPLIF